MESEFTKEKVFWTHKMNLKLVKFIENRPLLWNTKHPKYKSMRLRNRIYAEFAAEYGNEFTGQAVKDRWVNIRSTFGYHLRKMRINSSKDEEYKVKWHLWKACQFLHKAKRPTVDVIDDDTDKDNNQITKSEGQNIEQDITDESQNCNNIAEQLLKAFKCIQNDVFGLNQSKHAKIGQAVSNKLQNLNSYDAARLTQHITHILLLYDENNPENPNNNDNKTVDEDYLFCLIEFTFFILGHPKIYSNNERN